jgi:hypothetical protein
MMTALACEYYRNQLLAQRSIELHSLTTGQFRGPRSKQLVLKI